MNAALKSELAKHAVELVQNPKAAIVVSASAGTTGTLTMFDVLNNNIGVIATTLAAILSLTLIIGNIFKIISEKKAFKLQAEKSELEIQLLKHKVSEGSSSATEDR